MRNDEAQRTTVLGGERLTVVMGGEQYFFPVKVSQGHVGSESLFGVNQDAGRFRLGMDSGQQFAESHAVPVVVEAAPSGHTMEVAGALDFWERVEFLPAELERRINQAGDGEVPGLGIKPRNRTVVQNRPFQGERLAGGQQAFALLQFLELAAIIAFE